MKEMQFSNVDKIIIVGSSQEAIKFKPVEGYKVIAINQAIDITKEYTDYWFTLDPSIANQKIMREQPYDCIYTAAVPDDFGNKRARLQNLRNPRPDNVFYFNRISGDGPLGSHYGLCENQNEIATGNSAYGAFNLAYHLGAKEIVLLGVSGDQRPKFDGTFCKRLSHLPDLFASALPQLNYNRISVYTANRISKIKCFPFKDIFKGEI